jgi:hypothetical protein
MPLINLARYMMPLSVLVVSSVVFICREPWNLSTHALLISQYLQNHESYLQLISVGYSELELGRQLTTT